ncbi:hypothetical protein ACIBHX_34730 [Nonomuraea sp. NPDC050536]|uniref:hypothetical protein n=1 Tax=Nonomuraea sp. NPDC050536 TaxID=3364366 RepID=UPI0037C66EEF
MKGAFAWHVGGNGWSLATLGRSLSDGVVVFWVSDHAGQKLGDAAQNLTEGIAYRARRAVRRR